MSVEDKPKNLKIRIFGAENCSYCKRLCEDMSMMSIPYDLVDANATENTLLCDKYNVDKLPHTQCYSSTDNGIIFEFVGPIAAQVFMNKVSEKISGKKGSVFNGRTICKNCKKN